MDIGDIISALVVLSFVVGPIIEAMRKGGQKKPPNQPSNQPRPAQKPTSAPLQPSPRTPSSRTPSPRTPSPRTQTSTSATTAQSKQSGWQTSSRQSANDLPTRLEEARRRVQEQQARGRSQPAQSSPAPLPPLQSSSQSPAGGSLAQPVLQIPRSQPQGQQPSFMLARAEPVAGLSPELIASGTSSIKQRPPVVQRPSRPARQQALLALDSHSIQRGFVWKQILDKPRYKQRLQEKKAFLHR